MTPLGEIEDAEGVVLRAKVFAYGFSWRKRKLVCDFTGRSDVHFISQGAAVSDGADLLLWGSAAVPAEVPSSVRVVRLEDGFLRSVGLGADLIRPISWVMDTRGIYYDARTPSDMEVLLQTTIFSNALTQRAALLMRQLVQSGLSKYNLSDTQWSRPRTEKLVVLVIGQVETDASIATGALDIQSNMALLQMVRQARPDAWLVYKPHPDVVAGLRRAGEYDAQANQWADEVLLNGSPTQLFSLVDEVHVMTSLTGFEALLRNKPVFCYGQPFYAGWGLTQDRFPHLRRTRRLTMEELVAGALLLYPVYVSCDSRKRCSPEQALQELIAWRHMTRGRLPWWRVLLRPFLARS